MEATSFDYGKGGRVRRGGLGFRSRVVYEYEGDVQRDEENCIRYERASILLLIFLERAGMKEYNAQCKVTLYHVHCTMYIVHFTMYNVKCTMYNVYNI